MKNYEIKKGRKWYPAKSESMQTVNNYCKENGYSDWRVLGMVSRIEMEEFNHNAINAI